MSLTLATTTPDHVAHARALAGDLRRAFVERDDEIRCLLVALVAEEHVLLLGDPGTGKSALTHALTRALGGAQFQVLMTRFTVPEEVFGPISLAGLERDEYRRVTAGYLPTATIAFLDEVFKANSAILNSLLTALNERAFDDGGRRLPIPLQLCVGASNELPEDSTLDALFDRFVLRRWVQPIADRDAFRRLLATTTEPTTTATLSPADLDALRADARAVVVPDDVLDALLAARDALAQEHGIHASDRRWRKAMKLVRAVAAIDGRQVATRDDLLVLVDALWRRPEDRPAIYGAIAKVVAPDLAEALRLLDAATELYGEIKPKLADASSIQAASLANRQVKDVLVEMRKLDQSGPVADACARVVAMQRDVAASIQKMIG